MTPESSLDLVALLQNSRDSLEASLAGITEEDACKRPGPDCWSAIDCVEHLAIAEELGLRRLKNAESLAEPVHAPERELQLSTNVRSRTVRVQAPPIALPKGRYASLAEAMEQFCAARQRTIEFVGGASHLRALQVIHPFFGPITGYEFVLLLIGHPMRHAEQIQQIREQIK